MNQKNEEKTNDLKPKCYMDEYDIEINSELTYVEGWELIRKIEECIELSEEYPNGNITIFFKDWTYSLPINKKDNLRIRTLLKELNYDRQYVKSICEFKSQ